MDDKDQTPLFVVDDDPKVLWPVTLRLPANGGRFSDYRFSALIRVLPEARYVDLLDEHETPERAPLKDVLAENAMRFPAHVAGFGDDLMDGAGNPITFSTAKLQELVTGPYGGPLSVGLWRAIAEVRLGARLGNFAPPPAAGADAAATGS